MAHVSALRQDRLRSFRQRLCAVGIPSLRPRRAISLAQQQLLDAVAVGQVTPGPVFTTATFNGYVLHGGSGALVATLGVFLPHSSSSPLTAPLLPKLRSSPTAGHIVDGINVASLALIGVVTWQLGRAAIVDSRLCLLQSLVQFFCR